MALTYHDIFVPGGYPKHTYNPRVGLNLEDRLNETKQNLCKLVTITGHTKSGKTVLTRKILPQEDSVWIDGGTISSESDFWQNVVEQLDLFQTVGDTVNKGSIASASGTAEAGVALFGVGGKGSTTAEHSTNTQTEKAKTRSLSDRIVALKGLRDTRIPLVIDDFHYIPREIQGRIVRTLKPLVFEGIPVVIIAIPHRRYDALKVEKEMTDRISPIDIPPWSPDELGYIPLTGFALLNAKLPKGMADRLVEQAIGSPHLMQDFCRGLCKLLNVQRGLLQTDLPVTHSHLDAVFRDVAETIGRPIFEKLARGPRQRTDRIERKLKDGRVVDIYELVLHGLASLKPGLISIEYEDLRGAIKTVSASEPPQLHEVARVLKHMATIAATDQSSTPVIDFEEDEKKLHITDPFFAFYLRWGELASERLH